MNKEATVESHQLSLHSFLLQQYYISIVIQLLFQSSAEHRILGVAKVGLKLSVSPGFHFSLWTFLAQRMEVFGTVTAALDLSRLLVSVIRNQYRKKKGVPRKCIELDKGLNDMNVTLDKLKGHKPESMSWVAKREVNRMSEHLEMRKVNLKN